GAGGWQVFANGPGTCWNCQTPVKKPPRLIVGQLEIMLNADTEVRSYQIDLDYDRDQPVATVSQNPNNPNQWGLRNRTEMAWHAEHPTGGSRTVQPGRSIALDRGLTIEIAGTVTKIEA